MAEAVVTLTPTESWDDGKRIHVVGTLGIEAAAATYAAGGLAVPVPNAPGVNAAAKPILFIATGISGYYFEYAYATDKLKARTGAAAQTGLTEVTAGAVPAGLSGDTTRFYAIYHKFSE